MDFKVKDFCYLTVVRCYAETVEGSCEVELIAEDDVGEAGLTKETIQRKALFEDG